MAFIPAVNTARLAFQYTQGDGSLAINRIFFESPTAFADGDMLTLATAAAFQWGETVAHDTSHEITLVSVSARDMTTSTSPEATYNPSSGNVGLSSDASTTLGTTFAITLRTGLAGISNRGRWFWVGFPSSFESGTVFNGLNASDAADMATKLMSMITALNSGTPAGQVVIASFFGPPTVSGHSTPRDTAVLTPVTSTGYHDLFIDFQRRRAPGHNVHR